MEAVIAISVVELHSYMFFDELHIYCKNKNTNNLNKQKPSESIFTIQSEFMVRGQIRISNVNKHVFLLKMLPLITFASDIMTLKFKKNTCFLYLMSSDH